MTTRIDTKFAELKAEGRPALVTYFMGGDPDLEDRSGAHLRQYRRLEACDRDGGHSGQGDAVLP